MASATEVQAVSRVMRRRRQRITPSHPRRRIRVPGENARAGLLLCLVLGCPGVAGSPAGVAVVVETLDAIRASHCAHGGPAVPPLHVEPILAEVAQRLAAGSSLSAAATAAGYRAQMLTSLYLQSSSDDALEDLIVQRFCDTVIDPELTDAGVFQQADQTWIVLARPRPPQAVVDPEGAIDRVVGMINEARQQAHACGPGGSVAVDPLRRSAELQRAAQTHARDLAATGMLAHEGSDGSRPADRVGRAGYAWSAVAENVASGPVSAEGVVGIWLASPGHCANLMSDRYSETGVAYAVSADGERVYWVQVFAAPR